MARAVEIVVWLIVFAIALTLYFVAVRRLTRKIQNAVVRISIAAIYGAFTSLGVAVVGFGHGGGIPVPAALALIAGGGGPEANRFNWISMVVGGSLLMLIELCISLASEQDPK